MYVVNEQNVCPRKKMYYLVVDYFRRFIFCETRAMRAVNVDSLHCFI